MNDHENWSKGADDGVRSAALDALDFLRCREDFWEQVCTLFLLDYQPPKSHFWCAFRWRLVMPQKTNNLSSKSVKSQNRHFKVLG